MKPLIDEVSGVQEVRRAILRKRIDLLVKLACAGLLTWAAYLIGERL